MMIDLHPRNDPCLSMDEDEIEDHDEGLPGYRDRDTISPSEISEALGSLCLLGGDPYLAMQITGIAIVDQFIMNIEYEVLKELHETDRTPADTMFLSAQTQMWIFAVYELLRTWREQAKNVIKWRKNGGLELKIQALEKKLPYRHYGQERRASQLRRVLDNSGIVDTIEADLRLTHILFADLEHLRISMAKHQVSGKAKAIAFAPGYGRINRWCGSLEYQMEAGQVIFDNINRRDIAESIRSFKDRSTIPSIENIAEFDRGRKELISMPLDFERGDGDF